MGSVAESSTALDSQSQWGSFQNTFFKPHQVSKLIRCRRYHDCEPFRPCKVLFCCECAVKEKYWDSLDRIRWIQPLECITCRLKCILGMLCRSVVVPVGTDIFIGHGLLNVLTTHVERGAYRISTELETWTSIDTDCHGIDLTRIQFKCSKEAFGAELRTERALLETFHVVRDALLVEHAASCRVLSRAIVTVSSVLSSSCLLVIIVKLVTVSRLVTRIFIVELPDSAGCGG